MKFLNYDVAVIGGGAAGLTAAVKCASAGKKTLIIDRDEFPGGVLLQCIHNGFGLHYFKTELTGPEYAGRLAAAAREAGADMMLSSLVSSIVPLPEGGAQLCVYSRDEGVVMVSAPAVILAMGCRERCRGNLGVPGDRSAGIFTAGLAQRLLNLEGLLPGTSAVIVGSGDIGLIMARRLSWCGVKVKAVLEIMPYPAGLSRNIAQCLEDFNIPLHLSTSVTGIYGRERVEYITMAPLKDGAPDLSQETRIDCDTVLFSVGLIPDNGIAVNCGIKLNPVTGGALVDSRHMTNIPGIYSCGNVLHVHDLVDYVSEEAEACAESIIDALDGRKAEADDISCTAGEGVRYTVPNTCRSGSETNFYMRAAGVMDKAELTVTGSDGSILLTRNLRYVKPAEMIAVKVPAEAAGKAAPGTVLKFALREVK